MFTNRKYRIDSLPVGEGRPDSHMENHMRSPSQATLSYAIFPTVRHDDESMCRPLDRSGVAWPAGAKRVDVPDRGTNWSCVVTDCRSSRARKHVSEFRSYAPIGANDHNPTNEYSDHYHLNSQKPQCRRRLSATRPLLKHLLRKQTLRKRTRPAACRQKPQSVEFAHTNAAASPVRASKQC